MARHDPELVLDELEAMIRTYWTFYRQWKRESKQNPAPESRESYRQLAIGARSDLELLLSVRRAGRLAFMGTQALPRHRGQHRSQGNLARCCEISILDGVPV